MDGMPYETKSSFSMTPLRARISSYSSEESHVIVSDPIFLETFGPSAIHFSYVFVQSRLTGTRFGIVLPGMGSHSPLLQSCTRPSG